jgi:hypothetical protein
VTATISETHTGNQNIAAAELYLDMPDWAGGVAQAMDPADGSFDSPVEGAVATVQTNALPVGRHLVLVRGKDAQDNWGPYTAAFLDVTPGSPSYALYLPLIVK